MEDHKWSQYDRILDVGGATGSFLAMILKGSAKEAQGVVCDLPAVRNILFCDSFAPGSLSLRTGQMMNEAKACSCDSSIASRQPGDRLNPTSWLKLLGLLISVSIVCLFDTFQHHGSSFAIEKLQKVLSVPVTSPPWPFPRSQTNFLISPAGWRACTSP